MFLLEIIDSYLGDNQDLRLAIAFALLFLIVLMLYVLLYLGYQARHYLVWGEFTTLSAFFRPFNHRADHSHLVNLTSRV